MKLNEVVHRSTKRIVISLRGSHIGVCYKQFDCPATKLYGHGIASSTRATIGTSWSLVSTAPSHLADQKTEIISLWQESIVEDV